jgi:hypothetical protein
MVSLERSTLFKTNAVADQVTELSELFWLSKEVIAVKS